MKKGLSHAAAAASLAVLATCLLTVGFVGTASATGTPPWEPDPNSVGGLVFYNASGQQITGGNLTDSPVAAYVEGTATVRSGDTVATLYGYLPVNGELPTEWSGEQLGESTTFPNASAPVPLNTAALPVETGASGDETLGTLKTDYPNTDTSNDGYAGMYQLRLYTNAAKRTQTATYDSADVAISGSTWSVAYPAPTLTTTTTSLSESPSSPQVAGTSVQLTATVSPSAPGTMQFEVGSTDIGSPVTVSAGTASISTSTLPVGTDSLSAIFTPAQFSAYGGSTGTSSFTVSPAPATNTNTALSVNPTTAAADSTVTITAAVTNASTTAALSAADGQVAFYDDGSSSSGGVTSGSQALGTVSLGSGGTAALTYSSFAQGAHNIVAQFTPADPSVYNSSTSLPLLFTATAPQYPPVSQDVDVTVPAGTLTITTPYSPSDPFNLGTAVLDPTGAKFTASAPFGDTANPSQGVTVTDSRAGGQPWTASATVTDFTDGASVINGQNLTLTDVTPSYVSGNALQSGDVTTTDVTNSAVYGPTAGGSDGLKGGPHQFASAATGDGSVYVDALLILTAPSSTPAGAYTATLTLTIV